MNRKLLKELADPYSKSLPKLPKTAGAGKTILKKTEEPNVKPFVSDYEPEGTIKPATPLQVQRRLDLDPKNISCMEDLMNNWIHYSAVGLFIAAAVAPVMLPLVRIPGQLWANASRKNIIKLSKQIVPAMRALPSNIPKLPSVMLRAGKSAGTWYLKPLKSMVAGTGQILSVFQGKGMGPLKGSAKIGLGGIKFVKNSFLVALILVIAYEKFGLKKFLNWGSNLDKELFKLAFEAVDFAIQFAISMDMAVEELALYANAEKNPECVMTNAIGSTIMASFLISGFAGKTLGPEARALYKVDDLSKLKSADDVAAFVSKQKGLLVSEFLGNVGKSLKPIADKAGVQKDVLTKYVELLGKGKNAEKAAEKALKHLKNSNVKNAEAFHKSSLAAYEKAERAFIKKMSKRTKDGEYIIKSFREGDDMKALQNLGASLINRANKTRKMMKLDPRFGSAAQGVTNSSSGTVLVSPRLMKMFAGNSVDDLVKGIERLEKAIANGEMGIRQAASIYSRSFSKNLSNFSDEFVNLMELPKDVSRLSAQQRTRGVLEAFSDLSSQSVKLEKALRLMDPIQKGSSKSSKFLSWASRSQAKSRDIGRINDAKIAVDSAMNQIRKFSKNATTDELLAIEKNLEKTYAAIKSASGAGRASVGSNVARNTASLGVQVGTIAALTALSGVVARTFFVGDTEDLETWQQADIAKSLAWDGVFPLAAIETFYVLNKPAEWLGFVKEPEDTEKVFQRALLQLIKNILSSEVDGNGNVRILRTLYEEIVFKDNDQLISKIAKQDVDELNILEIVNEFRKSKSKYENTSYQLFKNLGINDYGKGRLSFTPTQKYKAYRQMWHPVLLNIMIANSGLIARLSSLENDSVYNNSSTQEKEKYLKEKVFIFVNPQDVTENLRKWTRNFVKTINDKNVENSKRKLNEELIMKENNKKVNSFLEELVKEAINENYGKGYNPYPYHSHIGMEDEESPDFQQDWKDFELALVRDESRDTAIRVAKILVKDLELFGDVLDLVGKNQSVATEILKNLRKNEENS